MPEWAIGLLAVIVAIVSFLWGRVWTLSDKRMKKDQDLINRFRQVLPSDGNTITYLLKKHDFRNKFERELLAPIDTLAYFLEQPDSYFLNKGLENLRRGLIQELSNFQSNYSGI